MGSSIRILSSKRSIYFNFPIRSFQIAKMYQAPMQNNDYYPPMDEGAMNASPMGGGGFSGGFSHKAPVLATDMRCYFGCPEGFKKDFDLRLHLKVRHKNENENELRRAYQAAEEEIALTSSTASVFQCAICPKKFSNHRTFYDHVGKRAHNMVWLEYKAQYGRCEVESAPFECKICGRVVKYTRASITNHMKMVHSITWPLYLERIRNMRKGEKPKELPSIAVFECKICSASVKYIFREKHLKGVHKITQAEYIELFADEMAKNNQNNVPYNGMSQGVNSSNGAYNGISQGAKSFKEESNYEEPGSNMGAYPGGRAGNNQLPNYPLPPEQVPNYQPPINNNIRTRYPLKSETGDDVNTLDERLSRSRYAVSNINASAQMNNPPPQKNFIQPPTFKGKYDEKDADRASRSNFGNRNFQQQDGANLNNGQQNNSSRGP